MANPVYKSTSFKAIEARSIVNVDPAKNTQINNTINQFFTYFKAKHL